MLRKNNLNTFIEILISISTYRHHHHHQSSSSTEVFRVAWIVTLLQGPLYCRGWNYWDKKVSFRVKQFSSSGGTSKSWACSWTPPATKVMSHRLTGRSTPLHQQQEKHDLWLLTDSRLERQAVQSVEADLSLRRCGMSATQCEWRCQVWWCRAV